MRRGVPAFDQVVELGVDADVIVADEQPGRHLGVRGHQAADQRDHRIALVGNAEDDLIFRIVKGEGRGQRLFDVVLDAAGGAQDGDRRASVRNAPGGVAGPPEKHGNAAEMDHSGYPHGSENQRHENHCGGQCQ